MEDYSKRFETIGYNYDVYVFRLEDDECVYMGGINHQDEKFTEFKDVLRFKNTETLSAFWFMKEDGYKYCRYDYINCLKTNQRFIAHPFTINYKKEGNDYKFFPTGEGWDEFYINAIEQENRKTSLDMSKK